MHANLRGQASEIEPLQLSRPDAALAALRQRLGRSVARGEALAASAAYGAPWSALCELLRHFEAGFQLEQQALFGLPCFETRAAGERVCFIHVRSRERTALPLLLLHGGSASLAEFQNQILPLTEATGGSPVHVVCPSLPGFGLSSGEPCPRAAAATCAALMARLGYGRYLVHGSELGAKVALELAALDSAHVAASHVTLAPAYPLPNPAASAELSPQEKSRLLRVSELQSELAWGWPESPVEELALALSQVDQELGSPSHQLRDSLLTGLLLSWAFGNATDRAKIRATRLEPAPTCAVPVALNAFPLDAPSLQRFAAARYRIAEWQEHEHGGAMPALEQPALWLESLRRCAGQLG
jgi:microsomal epoxide hydrolase